MTARSLLRLLRGLEIELHHRGPRAAEGRAEQLLHEAFLEFGRSGRTYRKADITAQAGRETLPGTMWSQDFEVAPLGEGLALLTYRSAELGADGGLTRHALRASLWQLTPRGWQLRFHQGTATGPFARVGDGSGQEAEQHGQ